jgi:hypothetical protein
VEQSSVTAIIFLGWLITITGWRLLHALSHCFSYSCDSRKQLINIDKTYQPLTNRDLQEDSEPVATWRAAKTPGWQWRLEARSWWTPWPPGGQIRCPQKGRCCSSTCEGLQRDVAIKAAAGAGEISQAMVEAELSLVEYVESRRPLWSLSGIPKEL